MSNSGEGAGQRSPSSLPEAAAGASRQHSESPRRGAPSMPPPLTAGAGDISLAPPVARKRGRDGDAGEGSSSSGSRRQLVVVTTSENVGPPVPLLPPPPPPPALPYRCSLCPREFPTAKGLFGHMRSHPDRGWRGAYPPPVFSREEFADVWVQQGGGNAPPPPPPGHVPSAAVGTGAMMYDLNRTPEEEAEPPPPPPSSASAAAPGGGMWDRDLNKPPPPESDTE